MAVVYDTPGKRRQLARMARPVVAAYAEARGARAAAILVAHHSPGGSDKGTSPTITVEAAGRLDYEIVLTDPDGGALSVEFGRAGGIDRRGRRVGPMAPVAPLRGSA